ncbi:MAG: MFS transporter [Acidimicrobiales bacterium]
MAVTAAVLPNAGRGRRAPIDLLGAALLAAAVACVVLATTWGGVEHEWGSPTILGLAAGAVALVGMLLVVERRAQEPVVPIHLFSNRSFNVALSVSFIIGVAMFGSISFLPVFLQVVKGASATDSGLVLLPLMVGMLSASTIAGQVITRTGRYKLFPVTGCGVVALAMYLLSTMAPETSRAAVSSFMVLMGIGLGMSMQTLVLAVQNEVDQRELGVATSSVSFFRAMGGSVGVALFGASSTACSSVGPARRPSAILPP